MKNAFTRFVAALSLVGLLSCAPNESRPDTSVSEPYKTEDVSGCIVVSREDFFSGPSPDIPTGSYYEFSAHFSFRGSCPYESANINTVVEVDVLHGQTLEVDNNDRFSLSSLRGIPNGYEVDLSGFFSHIAPTSGTSSTGQYRYEVTFYNGSPSNPIPDNSTNETFGPYALSFDRD